MNTIGSVIQHAGEAILSTGGIAFAICAAIKVVPRSEDKSSNDESLNYLSEQEKRFVAEGIAQTKQDNERAINSWLAHTGAFSLIGAGAIALGSLMQSASKSRTAALEDE
jgi:hypothetical protein